MKNKLIALLVFCVAVCEAQVNFEKGYFIHNSGKRTECYIENLDWRSNPTAFNYKMKVDDRETRMENIVSVSEFGIDNESLYRRFQVNIEKSQSVTSYLQKGKNPVWKVETLFLHALVIGEASLYDYADGNIIKYFYETKSKPIEQLVYIRYLAIDQEHKPGNGSVEGVQENNQFRQQLLNAVKCGSMTEKDFTYLEYGKNALIKHFLAYNACGGAQESVNYNAAAEDKRETFALRVLAGAYNASASVSDPFGYYNLSTDLDQTIFKIGLEAEYILPFNKGTWSLFANPTYQKFDPSKNYVSLVTNPGFDNDKQPVHYTAKADYSSIEIPIGARRYFFLNQSSRIFINIAYVIDLSGSGSIVITNSDGLANASKNIKISSRNNFAVGLGYGYKRFNGELRYNFQRQISSDLMWDVNYTSIGLQLGYKIL